MSERITRGTGCALRWHIGCALVLLALSGVAAAQWPGEEDTETSGSGAFEMPGSIVPWSALTRPVPPRGVGKATDDALVQPFPSAIPRSGSTIPEWGGVPGGSDFGANLWMPGLAEPRELDAGGLDQFGIPLQSRNQGLEQRFKSGVMGLGELEAAGRLFESGTLDGEIDPVEAALWYRRAAEHGSGESALRLGWVFLRGEAFEPSLETAEHWFRESIRLDHAPGHTALGSLRMVQALSGDDASQVHDAVRLLERGLEDGDAEAAILLARTYLEGLAGYPADDRRGRQIAEYGASRGVSILQLWTAQLYANGRGGSRDPVRAYSWALLASADGSREAVELVSRLDDELDDAQRQRARDAAMTWVLQRGAVP